jgi:hypothetical protein
VTAISSNPFLIPNSGILLGGTGTARTITLQPISNRAGTAAITLRVLDRDGGSATTTFAVSVASRNDAPTISDLHDITVDEDTASGMIPILIGDAETLPADLTMTAVSSSPVLIPNANLVLGGGGGLRTLHLQPASNQSGSATVTVTVTDADGASSSDNFLVTVRPVNDPPTISGLPNQSTLVNKATSPLSFTISDVETPADSLVLTSSSSNPELVPVSNIALGGTGSDRTITILPATNKLGAAVITLTVTDADASRAITSFVLTVSEEGNPPFITSLVVQPDGQVELGFSGTAGQVYEVQGSTDLETWTTLGTATELGGGVFKFLDSGAPAFPMRFYRIFAP